MPNSTQFCLKSDEERNLQKKLKIDFLLNFRKTGLSSSWKWNGALGAIHKLRNTLMGGEGLAYVMVYAYS